MTQQVSIEDQGQIEFGFRMLDQWLKDEKGFIHLLNTSEPVLFILSTPVWKALVNSGEINPQSKWDEEQRISYYSQAMEWVPEAEGLRLDQVARVVQTINALSEIRLKKTGGI